MAVTIPASICKWSRLLANYFDLTPKGVGVRQTKSELFSECLFWFVSIAGP